MWRLRVERDSLRTPALADKLAAALAAELGAPLRIELRVGMTGQPSPVVVTSFAAPTVDPVFVGRSTTAQLTLANRGSTTETLGAASLSQPTGSNNPWHLVDGCAGTLAPGASCAITATFTPTVDWSGTALLRIPAASLLGQLEVPLVEHGVLDVTAPNVALPPVAALTTSSTATYASVATDSQSGVHDLDFRYRYARDSSATLSDWIDPRMGIAVSASATIATSCRSGSSSRWG